MQFFFLRPGTLAVLSPYSYGFNGGNRAGSPERARLAAVKRGAMIQTFLQDRPPRTLAALGPIDKTYMRANASVNTQYLIEKRTAWKNNRLAKFSARNFHMNPTKASVAFGNKCSMTIFPVKMLRKSSNHLRFGNLATGAFTVIRFFLKIFLNSALKLSVSLPRVMCARTQTTRASDGSRDRYVRSIPTGMGETAYLALGSYSDMRRIPASRQCVHGQVFQDVTEM